MVGPAQPPTCLDTLSLALPGERDGEGAVRVKSDGGATRMRIMEDSEAMPAMEECKEEPEERPPCSPFIRVCDSPDSATSSAPASPSASPPLHSSPSMPLFPSVFPPP